MSKEFNSGFIALLGPTNSGKSTLLNALVGQKISIVSPKVQTTYHGIRGVVNLPDAQLIFTDTPGFQRHPDRIAKLLNHVADHHAGECDLSLWVFDVANPRWKAQLQKLSKKISGTGTKETRFLLLNKVDQIAKPSLLPILKEMYDLDLFSEILPVSALKKSGTKELLNLLKSRLPEGDKYFPDEHVSDRNLEFRSSEAIREKIYELTHQEVPYAIRVKIDSWETHDEKDMPLIHASILVDAESRKGILIGKGAEKLKTIGMRARTEIEKMLGKQVCLKLHVKVEAGWKDDSREVKAYLELSR